MLSEAKAYIAGIGLVVVLAILGYFIYSYHSGQEEVKKDAAQIAVQDGQIKDQADTIETQKKAGEITNEVVAQRSSDGKQTDQDFDAITRRTQAEIDAIHNQPKVPLLPGDPLRPTVTPPVGVTSEQAQVSMVRINGLWDSFCLASPAAAECKKG